MRVFANETDIIGFNPHLSGAEWVALLSAADTPERRSAVSKMKEEIEEWQERCVARWKAAEARSEEILALMRSGPRQVELATGGFVDVPYGCIKAGFQPEGAALEVDIGIVVAVLRSRGHTIEAFSVDGLPWGYRLVEEPGTLADGAPQDSPELAAA